MASRRSGLAAVLLICWRPVAGQGELPSTSLRGPSNGSPQEHSCSFLIEPGTPYFWDTACAAGGVGCMADGVHPECRYCGLAPFVPCPVEAPSCTFGAAPAARFFWDAACLAGGVGCMADGQHPECRFCGEPPFVACPGETTGPPPTTRPSSTAPLSTTTPAPTQAPAPVPTPTPAPVPTAAPTPVPPPTTSVSTAAPTTTTAAPTTTTVPPPTTTRTTVTTTTTVFDMHNWVTGTWTTGYWDCCKPSCSWPSKGKTKKPVLACDAQTGEVLWDAEERSVCMGGRAATCKNNKPVNISEGLSLGFAAAAVSGGHGLTGDDNCGQCFELQFTDQVHKAGPWFWGGAGPELVNKRMIVQVTNIGFDVTGDHSFDIMIPGAGQGAFSSGCRAQFDGFQTDSFDCGNRFGGCHDRAGCDRLPRDLQDACRWRYDWYHWLEHDGRTNNPFVNFRRVRCPKKLIAISGSEPTDDDEYDMVDEAGLY